MSPSVRTRLAAVAFAATACTTTAEVDVIAVHSELGPEHTAGLLLASAIDGPEQELRVRLDGIPLVFEGDDEPIVTWSRALLGFTLPAGEHVVELVDLDEHVLLRTAPIDLAAGSNHVVAFGAPDGLRHVANHDAPVLDEGTTRARVTNALADRGPLDVLTCPPDAAPPDATCAEAAGALAYGDTWDDAVPRGHHVFARATRPGIADVVFRFTPDHRYNGAPEDETPCTASTRGSLITLGWSATDCADPWSEGPYCLDAIEAHDNNFGELDDPRGCEAP